MGKHYRFEIFQDRRSKWRFRLVSPNGQIMISSQAYKSRDIAIGGVKGLAAVFGAVLKDDSFEIARDVKPNRLYDDVGQLDEREAAPDVAPEGELEDTEPGD